MTGPTLFQSNPRHSVQVGPPSIFVEAGSEVFEKVGVSPGRTSYLIFAIDLFCILAEFSLKLGKCFGNIKCIFNFFHFFLEGLWITFLWVRISNLGSKILAGNQVTKVSPIDCRKLFWDIARVFLVDGEHTVIYMYIYIYCFF